MGGASSILARLELSTCKDAEQVSHGRKSPRPERERLLEICAKGVKNVKWMVDQLADILPFPGPEACNLVGKLLGMVDQAFVNRDNLKELSKRAVAFLKILAVYQSSLDKVRYQDTLTSFNEILEGVTAYYDKYLDRNCIARVLTGASDDDEFMQLSADLTSLVEDFQVTLAADNNQRLQALQEELALVRDAQELLLEQPIYKDQCAEAKALAQQLGGVPAVMADKEKLLKVIQLLDLPHCMTMTAMASLAAELAEVKTLIIKGNKDHGKGGPYRYIRQPDLKTFWKLQWKKDWEVPWEAFWEDFPEGLSENPVNVEIVSRLQDLLGDETRQAVFQRCVNKGNTSDVITAMQLKNAFTIDELVPQVEQKLQLYQKLQPGLTNLNSAAAFQIEPPPQNTVARHKDVDDVINMLRTHGSLNSVASPGTGNSTVASQAAWLMLDSCMLPGGALRVDLTGATLPVEVKNRFLSAIPQHNKVESPQLHELEIVVGGIARHVIQSILSSLLGAEGADVSGGGPCPVAEAREEGDAESTEISGDMPSTKTLLLVDNVDDALLRSEAGAILQDILAGVREKARNVWLLVTSSEPLSLISPRAATSPITNQADVMAASHLPTFRLGQMNRSEARQLVKSIASDLTEHEVMKAADLLGGSPLVLMLGAEALAAGRPLKDLMAPPDRNSAALEYMAPTPASVRHILDLLSSSQQAAAAQLATFPGTFTDEAAAAVLNTSLFRARTLLQSLQQYGVLHRSPVVEEYTMHSTVRQQACQLDPTLYGEAEERFAGYMLSLTHDWSATVPQSSETARSMIARQQCNLDKLFRVVTGDSDNPVLKSLMESQATANNSAPQLAGLVSCMLSQGRSVGMTLQFQALKELLTLSEDSNLPGSFPQSLGNIMSPTGKEAAQLVDKLLQTNDTAIVNQSNLVSLGQRAAALLKILAVCENTLPESVCLEATRNYKAILEDCLEYSLAYTTASCISLVLSPNSQPHSELIQCSLKLCELARNMWNQVEADSNALSKCRDLGPEAQRAIKTAMELALLRPQWKDPGFAAKAVAAPYGGLDKCTTENGGLQEVLAALGVPDDAARYYIGSKAQFKAALREVHARGPQSPALGLPGVARRDPYASLHDLPGFIVDAHEAMPPALKQAPVRLLRIAAVLQWRTLKVFEEVDVRTDCVEMPYSQTDDALWSHVLTISWRWSEQKPKELRAGFSPMSGPQFRELWALLKTAQASGMEYVWIDWCCVPQYRASSMYEVHRSKIFYARARAMFVVPTFRPLPDDLPTQLTFVRAQRALVRLGKEEAALDAALAAEVMKGMLDKNQVAGREYFGRVWTRAERMARFGRNESLSRWLSLESWLGMLVDSMLESTENAGSAVIYKNMLGKRASELMDNVLKRLRAVTKSAMLNTRELQELDTLIAKLFKEAVGVWVQPSMLAEAASVQWLRTYLGEEARSGVYQACNEGDRVWAIYSYFCWRKVDEDSRAGLLLALEDLASIAGPKDRKTYLDGMFTQLGFDTVADGTPPFVVALRPPWLPPVEVPYRPTPDASGNSNGVQSTRGTAESGWPDLRGHPDP